MLPASHCKVSAKLCVEKFGSDGQGWAPPGRPQGFRRETPLVRPLASVTVAILAQGTHWAVATSQAFFIFIASLPCPPNFHQARQKHMHIRTGNITFRWRPYRVECTGSLLTSEVKRHRARLVLGWGTAWEHPRVLPAFLLLLLLLLRALAFERFPFCDFRALQR